MATKTTVRPCVTQVRIFKYLLNDAPKLTKEDKETCIDWIVENKLDIGLDKDMKRLLEC